MRPLIQPGVGKVCPDVIERQLCSKENCNTLAPTSAPTALPKLANWVADPRRYTALGTCSDAKLALSILNTALDVQKLSGALASDQSLSLMAPTNTAFRSYALNSGCNRCTKDVELLKP